MNIAKRDVVEASGSGQKSGSEAAIHAMPRIFEADDTDAVLLIYASNEFNALNKAAALLNIRVLCPVIAVYAVNTYRHSARLFITGGKEITSAEGTTQGDPLAMAIYALSTQPLITSIQAMSDAKQCWFAADACGAGTISEIKQWWDGLNKFGPDIGYFPNGKKCWIVAKPEKEALVKVAFKDTAINVTVEGQKHLGAVIGSRDCLQDYVNEKVTNCVNEVVQLVEFAQIQPQASYAAYTFGLKHHWTYFLRIPPDIQDLLEPLEEAISQVLIPAIVGRKCSKLDRDALALPVRLGGLSLSNPCHEAAREHASSTQVTPSLVEHIMAQTHQLPDESLIASGPLPLQEHGFNLGKREFRDAVKLRYDWPFDDIPSMCACGENLTVDHAMICKRGGFVIQRHNEFRDLEADLLSIVCTDVEVGLVLQDITEEQLSRGSNRAQDARLDVRARGFWDPQSSAFLDVRVCLPNAESYKDWEPQQIYRIHENDKKRLYSRRVLDVEHGSFTPLVFTTTGGMGMECIRYHCRLAELIAAKKGERYSQTISWIRAKTSFALLWSALVCLRGSRVKRRASYDYNNCDFEIAAAEGAIDIVLCLLAVLYIRFDSVIYSFPDTLTLEKKESHVSRKEKT
ncbi:hypothetical protein AWC38_SpisGene1723 [Stylophora pistillata]|uniref:Reverse transcriptase domain-containing protein n=1 Tax=Stylophora pistillata TaxID=50429 RepID=A0A2B4SXT6_STYPI|nr:hypothetical protein AWC38_SpisGene1723 [Stylophora pistillata]